MIKLRSRQFSMVLGFFFTFVSPRHPPEPRCSVNSFCVTTLALKFSHSYHRNVFTFNLKNRNVFLDLPFLLDIQTLNKQPLNSYMFFQEGRDSKIPESDIKRRVIWELEPKIKLLASLIWICTSFRNWTSKLQCTFYKRYQMTKLEIT